MCHHRSPTMGSFMFWLSILALAALSNAQTSCYPPTSNAGAIVNYEIPPPTQPSYFVLGCSPASGSLFPIGNTTVTCEQLDEEGNVVPGPTFIISVCPQETVNDCATNNGGCSEFATCVTTGDNAHTCTCNTGYAGDGVSCTQIDECASFPCQNNGVCLDLVNAFVCNCTGTGYTGTVCDADVNECNSTAACPPNTHCVNTIGGYNCTVCAPGSTFNQQYEACLPCEVGTFWNSSDALCADCPVGRFQNQQSSVNCMPCGVGQFSSLPAATNCMLCDINQFSNGTGFTVCYNCTDGQVAPERGSYRCITPLFSPSSSTGSDASSSTSSPGNSSTSSSTGVGSSSGTSSTALNHNSSSTGHVSNHSSSSSSTGRHIHSVACKTISSPPRFIVVVLVLVLLCNLLV